ncbi:MAG: VWA domain-containing protein [Thermodesulforhabdaceae bacterium]
MIEFFYRLRDAGFPVSVHGIMDFYDAVRKGLVRDIDSLFLVTRLIFVKRVEHYDIFEQTFSAYFYGEDGYKKLQEWEDLFNSKPFKKWLDEEVRAGRLSPEDAQALPMEELIRRFWETVMAQREAHHGGSRWIGTGGSSPYGHSASAPQDGGIRVYGGSVHGTARKVIGERRYINYADDAPLTRENLRQILSSMKSLRPIGPLAELDVDETIYRTAKNGGEIELIFRRELRNKVEIIVLLDNGGYSMTPYIPLVKTLFHRIRDTFEHVRYYYFHNCIYGTVYKNPQRTEPVRWDDLLQLGPKARLIIIGDANMAPSELMASFGSIDMFTAVRKPGYQWLQELRKAFPASVWLNPIRKELWQYESSTIRRIATIFHMEDLTLGGLKRAVEYLNIQGTAVDAL